MPEIWKPVNGYEGIYEVSNLGRVKSLNVRTLSSSGKYYTRKERMLKIATRKDRYQYVILCNCGLTKMYTIHRLVAQAFIPNPDNLPCVNHKDENPSNNCVDNLEWCDQKYNSNYGNCKKKRSKKSKAYHNLLEVKKRQSEIMKNFYANNPNPNKGKKRTSAQKAYMKKRQAEGIAKRKERKYGNANS